VKSVPFGAVTRTLASRRRSLSSFRPVAPSPFGCDARVHEHLLPRRPIEAVGVRALPRRVPEPDPHAADPPALRVLVPGRVVRRGGVVLLPADLPDAADIRGTGDEDVAVRLLQGGPLVRPHVPQLLLRELLERAPVGVLVLEEEDGAGADVTELVDELLREGQAVVPRLHDDVLALLDREAAAHRGAGDGTVVDERFPHGLIPVSKRRGLISFASAPSGTRAAPRAPYGPSFRPQALQNAAVGAFALEQRGHRAGNGGGAAGDLIGPEVTGGGAAYG